MALLILWFSTIDARKFQRQTPLSDFITHREGAGEKF